MTMRTLAFFLTLLTGASLMAQNALTVFSETGDPFYLILNGVRQNEAPETNVRVTGLLNDGYAAKIIFADDAHPEIEKRFLAVTGMDCAAPCAVTYRIKESRKGDLKMTPFTFQPMAMAPPPPPNVTVVPFNTQPMSAIGANVQVTETTTTTVSGGGTMGGTNVNVGVGGGAGGGSFGMNVTVNDPTMQQTTMQQTTVTTTTTTTGGGAPAGQPVVNDCRMNPGPFSQAMESIRSKTWDESRLEVATQIARTNCLTAAQIRDIMRVMEWEESRVTFARQAYSNCADPNNYFMVHDAFEWESSIDELNRSIGQ